jgi:hypothetical protein
MLSNSSMDDGCSMNVESRDASVVHLFVEPDVLLLT